MKAADTRTTRFWSRSLSFRRPVPPGADGQDRRIGGVGNHRSPIAAERFRDTCR